MSDNAEENDVPVAGATDRLKTDAVWIDADVYRAARFDWGSRQFTELTALAGRGLIQVIETEITRREIMSLMREMWLETSKAVQSNAAAMKQLGLQDAVAVLSDEEASLKAMVSAYDWWLIGCRRHRCTSKPDLDAVLENYFEGRPPFGPGKKRAEFPDALVLSSLKAWCAQKPGRTIYIVSNDQGVQGACVPDGPLIATKSLNEVLSHGRASAAIYDALACLVKESDYVRNQVWDGAAELDVSVESGYRRNSRINLELGVDGAITLEEAYLVESRLAVDFDEVASRIE